MKGKRIEEDIFIITGKLKLFRSFIFGIWSLYFGIFAIWCLWFVISDLSGL